MSRVIMFGSDRHAHIWSLRHGIPRKDIRLATQPDTMEFLRGEKEPVVVTVPAEHWKPMTSACERRVKDSIQAIKDRKQQGVTVKEMRLE